MIEKKEQSFGKSLLQSVILLFCIMIFLGSIGCIIFYRYAAVYEVTRPELKMDELMESMSPSDWYNLADKTSCESVSEFEKADVIFEKFYTAFCSDQELSYREAFSENEKTEAKFVVRAGNNNLYDVVLKAREDVNPGFGRHYWELDKVELSDFTSSLQAASVEVYAEGDDSVLINSVPVGGNYYEMDTEWPGLSEQSKRFSAVSQCRKYAIGKMFGDIIVTDSEGNELEAVYDSDNDVYRYVCLPTAYSVTIEAPEDVTVLLCGQELTQDDVSSVKNSLFRDLSEYTKDNEWESLVYSVDNILDEPTVEAFDSAGKELSPVVTDSGRIMFFHENDEAVQTKAQPSVEAFFKAYMAYSSSRGGVSDLLACTLRNTRLNSYFRYSTEGMYWASDTIIEYDELEFANFYALNEDCIYCTIQFKGNFSAQAWHENYSYEMKNGYEMVFVRNGRTWLAAEMCAFE